MLNKKSVDDINVKGKKVLVRCDFNVPLQEGKITDENRLVAALPTIKKLIADGGRVILCSHLGKPKGEAKPELSLAPVAKRLSELLGQEVKFAADAEVVGPNAKAAVEAAYEHVGPVYLRFGRLAVPVINDNPDYKFELGKAVTLREGTDVTIIASGLTVSESLVAAEKLAADGISAEVINMHTIKPLDEEAVIKAAAKTGKIVTAEEHSVIGGLGSAVCDVVAEKAPAKVLKIGVNDTYGESGPAVELIKKYGLDADSIYEKVKAFV